MKIIWVNGTFDILHVGHIALLEHARSVGDYLVVGIDSDERVRELKSKDRPINCLEDRKTMLEALRFVDKVVTFGTDEELENWIKQLQPIMVIGDDYKDKRVVGSEFAKGLYFFTKVDGYSTTKILEK